MPKPLAVLALLLALSACVDTGGAAGSDPKLDTAGLDILAR